MSDFIFGTLATDALRLEHVRARRGGVTHAQRRAPRDPLPGQTIVVELSLGPQFPFNQAWVYWTADGSDPVGERGIASNGQATRMELVACEWDTLLWGYVRRFQASLPGQVQGTVLRYRLSAGQTAAGAGQEILADGGAYYACYIADDPPPAWASEAVVYQIFVDRFAPGEGKEWLKPPAPSGFYGGRLRGITENLDYIQRLGANVLWLTPIFPSPSHHGYDATDLFEIEPRLGSKEDLRNLLEEAHGRRMHVLLDFVPNHWSHLHANFQQAILDPQSPTRAWYNFTHWPDEYETFFGVKELPQVNLRHPAARQHMLEAVRYWLDFGVDGYRVDYALGPTPDFWADFRRVTRQAKADCWTFGEVVEPSDSQLTFEGGLDGCLDFILLEALRQTFAFSRWTPSRLAGFLQSHESFFPETFTRPSFLDNHDMNRFLWVVGGDKRRLRLAALCQFTLAGQPVIYYGTEVGLSQERDVRQGSLGIPEESRLPMLWGEAQDVSLLEYYRALIRLRNEKADLRRNRAVILAADEAVLVYRRGGLAVALNTMDDVRKVRLVGSWDTVLLASLTGCSLRRQGEEVILELAPLGGMVIG
ncbi:MAG: hypothetical protein JW726_01525 [Anaerolineales bacterium]|nr:hypothetical protein [Anaerolineales bacterium]